MVGRSYLTNQDKRELHLCNTPESLVELLCENITAQIKLHQAQGDYFRMALSGGSTPEALYKALGRRTDIDWTLIEAFMVDERFVLPDDPDNNARMILKAFNNQAFHLQVINTVHVSDAEASAANYARVLATTWPISLPQFDLILLGIGKDGHTASLFPGTRDLEVSDKTILATQSPVTPHQRISLSLPVLNAARRVVFLAQGGDKADILKRILIDKDATLPASHVLPAACKPEFWMDMSCASSLLDVVGT